MLFLEKRYNLHRRILVLSIWNTLCLNMNKEIGYYNLDPRRELEQRITGDLKRALGKRGFSVKHNGTREHHAPGDKPDIEVYDRNTVINVEVTKTKKSQSDREYLAIKDHLEKTKRENQNKNCYIWYVSPATHYRMFNAIKEYNFLHKEDSDQKILPISFEIFELFIKKLIQAPREQYSRRNILTLFDDIHGLVDDETAFTHFYKKLFSNDEALGKEIKRKESVKHQKIIEKLIGGFKNLENQLRSHRIALATEAIKNVIYLVFIKLYEEKREIDGKGKNRFTEKSFQEFQETLNDYETATHKLFKIIQEDPDIEGSGLFTERDRLVFRLKDSFVLEKFIKEFEPYQFYATKVDGLGAAYEVLGQLSGKDVKAGQFFTPQRVVQFMVELAELTTDDKVYDPACGTARFLTTAMEKQISLAKRQRNASKIIQAIKQERLYGTDDDLNVAKLAKMNMYIHNDGKANIQAGDGLLNNEMDGMVDIVLTNPPLGNLSYRLPLYNEDFYKRLEILPKNNKTVEKLNKYKKSLQKKKEELSEFRQENKVKLIVRKSDQIKSTEKRIIELEIKLERGEEEIEITGNEMKGGALFLARCKDYLKDIRDSNLPPEWRGGKLILIMDEGVLNTHEYFSVREFIQKYYHIKAVFSLTSDTFVPVSRTRTKTSVLYLIKKEDPDTIQKEPIFFGHVSKVGLDTKKKVCENHLAGEEKNMLSEFLEFKKKIYKSYNRSHFDKDKFNRLCKQRTDSYQDINNLYLEKGGLTKHNLPREEEKTIYNIVDFEDLEDRLDTRYYLPIYYSILKKIEKTNYKRIGDKDLLEEEIITGNAPAKYKKEPGVNYLKVRNLHNGYISEDFDYAPEGFLKRKRHCLLKKDDILLVSLGIGSIGKVDIYESDEECLFDPKITRIRVNKQKILPRYLLAYLRSSFGQKLIERNLRGSTGQIMFKIKDLKNMPIPMRSLPKQKRLVERINQAQKEIGELRKRADQLEKAITRRTFNKMGLW